MAKNEAKREETKAFPQANEKQWVTEGVQELGVNPKLRETGDQEKKEAKGVKREHGSVSTSKDAIKGGDRQEHQAGRWICGRAHGDRSDRSDRSAKATTEKKKKKTEKRQNRRNNRIYYFPYNMRSVLPAVEMHKHTGGSNKNKAPALPRNPPTCLALVTVVEIGRGSIGYLSGREGRENHGKASEALEVEGKWSHLLTPSHSHQLLVFLYLPDVGLQPGNLA